MGESRLVDQKERLMAVFELENNDNLLWVFDTQQYLEIFAPTRDEAEAKAAKVEEETGLEFVLEYDWEIRQAEHAKGERGSN